MVIRVLAHLIQLVGILVPLAGCVSLIRKIQSRASMYLLLANLGCLIINGSYMLLLQTKVYESAMIALKMQYFGNVVFYLMFAMFLWAYLRMKRHKWVKALFGFWCIIDVVFLLSVWVVDGFPLVFHNLHFQWDGRLGLVLIDVEPGVLFLLRYSLMCILLLCGMLYTTGRMFAVKVSSERNNLAKLAGAQLLICTSLILMLMFNFSFDIVPICASLSILSIIVSVHRDEFFGIMEIGREWVFEQMEDAFVIVDEMYGYLDSNAYAKKVFGELNFLRKNKMVSGKLYELFVDVERIQRIQGKYYNKKIMEIREKGVLTGYCLLLVDITEQYVLMERVKEEKERADAANKAKSAFVSNVSHEIRTPMNAIVGMTQIMLRRDLPEQDRAYLMNIRNSGNALLTIVNDLLDMSKIEAGKMELVDEEYDFMGMLNDLGMIILNRIGNKPVELLYDIDPDIPAKLYGDALRIRQVIINIMNNATKFTEEGFVCLTVRVNRIEQEDLELFVSVKDTGQGIREEDLGKLFGTFQQVDTGKNHHKEGTGLGLSISRQLVELMQGKIGVQSEYGKGSEFYFTIHQRIVDGRKAVRLEENLEAVIAGNMKMKAAGDMLERLTERYALTYVDDLRALASSKTPIFYFTDQYGALSEEERQKLSVLGAVVCELQNPMLESDSVADICTMNKPLFSYNFCNFIQNRDGKDGARDCAEAVERGASEHIDLKAGSEVSGHADPGAVGMRNRAVSGTDSGSQPGEDELDFLAPEAYVLIVDDNEINCMVAEEMLKPLQMRIEIASDGRQALEMVRKKQYDLVFMDHFMPVMDGIDASREIRGLEDAYYREVPIIALTANTATEQREAYLQAGMSDFLSKPIDMTELYKIVKKWIPHKVRHNQR